VFKDKFLPLMKALLVSRVIAKAPLGNANDIRELSRSKIAFEKKGYENEDLMKLLIVTHRLWTPNRMKQFVGRIPTVSTAAAAPAVSTAAAAAAPAAAAAAAPAAARDDRSGFKTPVPSSVPSSQPDDLTDEQRLNLTHMLVQLTP
jgi:hypothetical protein